MPEFELFSDSDNESKQERPSLGHKKNLLRNSETNNSENKQLERKSNNKKSDANHNESDSEYESNIKYIPIKINKLVDLEPNTIISYIKNNGKEINNKYFKSYDIIKKILTVGFYKHDKKNYEQSTNDIKEIFICGGGGIIGGRSKKTDDRLKDTILIPHSEWDKIQQDTVISYKKKDQNMVYCAKFNSYVTSKKDNLTRMSLQSATGQPFLANPVKIETIYRHFTSKDKTLAQIMQSLKQLEIRISKLEKQVYS